MTLVTTAPNSVISNGSNFTGTGGTLDAVTADSSDATYFQKNTPVGTQSVCLGVGTLTIGAGEIVKRVRLHFRAATPTSVGKMNFYIGTRVRSQNMYQNATPLRGVNAIADFVGAWFSAAPDGNSWDQVRITNLRILVTDYNDSTDRGTVYKLYIDVDKATQPTVTASAPTGTITSTSTPAVTWAYTDPDAADPQAYYQVRVFTAAQYGIGGFDPATSPCTWDSGTVGSSDGTVTIGQTLVSAGYRAYIRVAKNINSAPYWSAWAYSGFTLSLTPPTVPTLVGSWSAPTGAATLTLTGAVPTGFTSQRFEAQRSNDGGVTWAYIRSGNSITPNGSYIGTVSDYEAPRGITVYYHVRSVGVDATGAETPSAWSGVQQILVTSDLTWWIKCPLNPALNMGGVLVQTVLKGEIVEPQQVFRPLKRGLPVVVSGTLGGFDGEYEIKTTTTAQSTALMALLTYQGTLLVQDPLGRQKYIRVTNRPYEEKSLSTVQLRQTFSVKYVQVSA